MGSIQQPLLIQYDPKHSTHNNDKVPLVLFHDGGGTIFNYFLLRDLKRQVYGIFDPRFELDEAWPGGLDEMADHYAELVLSLTCDSIILGGEFCIMLYKYFRLSQLSRAALNDRATEAS